MSDELTIARNYLLPPKDSFWIWQDGGEVITWIDGKSITFRLELGQILKSLAPIGLPPLGSVLLLIAATRDSWGRLPNERGLLAGCLRLSDTQQTKIDVLTGVLARLDKVRALAPWLRSTTETKAILAEMVFEHSTPIVLTEQADIIVRQLYLGIGEVIDAPITASNRAIQGPRALLDELRCLAKGLDQVDAESLQLRRETGLDALPQASEFEFSAMERVRGLLTELDHDEELRGLANLAQRLMAAVALPRAVTDREELQVGGVSDISNRGPLDRLLLSELAHDDFALAVRVAMNEALFLRRESPPRTRTHQRAILLESGIRSWGVPRVFATAVAMAMMATSEQHTKVNVFRAKKIGIDPVDLTTRSGLVTHLSVLEPELHPGEALDAFEKEIARSENSAEPLLVTTEDTFEDKEFQAELNRRSLTSWLVATVNRDGRFRLIELSTRGSKLFRETMLSLDGLFVEPKRVTPKLIDRDRVAGLPAIFSVEPFPLLLSHNIDPKRILNVTGRGVLSLSKDRRLMYWTSTEQGAIQIADNIPRGALWWFSRDTLDSGLRAVVGFRDPQGLSLLHIELDQLQCLVQSLAIDRGVEGICSHNGALFAVYRRSVSVIDEQSGNVIHTLEIPARVSLQHDRFFREDITGRWYALSYDGRTAHLEPVFDEIGKHCPKLLTLFERNGGDGPIGVTALGDLCFTSTGSIQKIDHRIIGGIMVRSIARDGSRIALSSTESVPGFPQGQAAVIDAETLIVDRYVNDNAGDTEPNYRNYVRPKSIRRQITHIYDSSDGLLILLSRRQRHLAIDYDPSVNQILLNDKPDSGRRGNLLCFKNISTQLEVGYVLSRATWDDGSEAFLDSRGLLHLISSDVSLPEVSIVLNDGPLSGWCSDGRMWGEQYFTGEQQNFPQRPVFDVIRAFSERIR